MEPTNHPFRKENDLNHTSMIMFHGTSSGVYSLIMFHHFQSKDAGIILSNYQVLGG